MSERSVLAPSDGGLGYKLRDHQLKSRLNGYRDPLKVVLEAHVEVYRERQIGALPTQTI